MFEHLLPYFNKELSAIRRLAGQFAEAHPKIAGRLKLGQAAGTDPHVERLIEAVAFMNARVRQRMDSDYDELVESLLEVLYPHYTQPLPSMVIATFAAKPDAKAGVVVGSGTYLDGERIGDVACRFRTCYPVTVYPIAIEAAVLSGRPLASPVHPRARDAAASLRLRLGVLKPGASFAQFRPDTLRFFLAGQPQQVFPLYEAIFNNALGVAVTSGPDDPAPLFLGRDAIGEVGFSHDEGILPYPPQTNLGYRLLTEYFAYPDKFRFFDLGGLGAKTATSAGSIDIHFYFDRLPEMAGGAVGPENFALGCTPAVNLYQTTAEPVMLDHTRSENRLVADARLKGNSEIVAVEKVSVVDSKGQRQPLMPFYGGAHSMAGRPNGYWLARRRPALDGGAGTDLFLSVVELDLDTSSPADSVIMADVLASNRDLPSRLPFGIGHPVFHLVEPQPQIASVVGITPPTPPRRPAVQKAGWRLVSQLSLNHLPLADGADNAARLREILDMHDFTDSAEGRSVTSSIRRLQAKPGTARAPWGGGLCRGMDVILELDPQPFSGSSLFMLAAVLERFLALYCSINTFSRLTAVVEGRSGELRTWPARSGDHILL